MTVKIHARVALTRSLPLIGATCAGELPPGAVGVVVREYANLLVPLVLVRFDALEMEVFVDPESLVPA